MIDFRESQRSFKCDLAMVIKKHFVINILLIQFAKTTTRYGQSFYTGTLQIKRVLLR